MSTITNIDLSLPNDGDGTKLRTGGGFINANFANLNADKLERGGYAGTAQDIVNLIGAGVSPVENDYADISAMLADQANQTEDFLQFVVDATDDPNFDPVGDEIYAFYRYLGTTNSSLIDYVLLSPSEAAEVIVTPNYRQFEVKNVNDNIDDTTATGSVLVKTEDNEIIAILFDPSFSKYLQGFKTLLDDEGKEFYIKSYNKTSAGKKLYVAKVSSIEYADVGETCYLVEVGANLTGGILTATDIIEVFFDLDFTGGVGVESVTGDSVDNTDPLNPVVNAIPLSGTEVGSPVTGDIEISDTKSIKWVNAVDDNRSIITSEEGVLFLGIADDSNPFFKAGIAIGSDSSEGATITVIDNTSDPDFKGIKGSSYYGANYDDNTYVQKKYVDDTKHTGKSLYNATTTGTVNLDCATFDSWYRILTGNTDFTFSNTPASGETFVKTLEIITTAGETCDFSTADKVIGTFVNDDTTVNIITINFANYPTVGLRVTVMINS